MRGIKEDKRGNSYVIAAVLGLIIVATIVADIFLWNYELNQIDWEKMNEAINIVDVTPLNESWSFNPSAFIMEGSTSWVSGTVSNLTADDNVHMTYRSYFSGTNTSDFIDNNVSNVDSSLDKGSHSNFTAQQTGPDSIMDTLAEEDTMIKNTTVLNDGFEAIDWDAKWDDISHNWLEDDNPVHSNSASAWATQNNEGYFTCDNLNASAANAIYVDFWFRKDDTEFSDFTLYYFDGTTYDLIDELDDNGGDDIWLHYSEIVTDSQYFTSKFRIRFDATLVGGENVWIDDVLINVERGILNYELDLEVQFTNVTYNEDNEELCIYGGSMDEENIKVDVWNGYDWQNVLVDLQTGWNNVSISSFLTSSTLTIRFHGSNETGDTTQENWDIDVTLLHVWTDHYTAEVEFTGSSNTNYWTQLNWTVDSSWTVGSVNVTLQLYNFALGSYPTSGYGYLAYTSDGTPNTDENQTQTVNSESTPFRNATGHWKIKVKGARVTVAQFDFKVDLIEFKPRSRGTQFIIENEGSLTVHLVAIWVNNSTRHKRYDIESFINAGDQSSLIRSDINLPAKPYIVKAVTERGNIAVFSES